MKPGSCSEIKTSVIEQLTETVELQQLWILISK